MGRGACNEGMLLLYMCVKNLRKEKGMIHTFEYLGLSSDHQLSCIIPSLHTPRRIYQRIVDGIVVLILFLLFNLVGDADSSDSSLKVKL